ncbi:ABC transporter substrate-binding protein [Conexibacter sp. S30A1]|uniref:ABC transporter substrate-binding protein n=1 Tax=Conexibacter sp. S30A1 TaxID=2937800 RepID=UPI00200C5A16|nr:ABC transporter substrate-binding protein [Conexibacter sp. S30A1]
MKRILNKRSVQAAVATGAIVVGGSAGAIFATAGSATAAVHAKAASSSVLTVESSPVGQANGFNPFVPTSASSIVGATSLIYEPLFQADILKPGKYYPFLATSYKWGAGGRSITFTIRRGVKWSNGTAFTPADVAFTYNLIKHNPAINGSGLTISGVSMRGDTVTLHFPTPQYANFQNIAGDVYIVPQSIWQSAGNPSTYADTSPVGTGPYTVSSVGASGVVMTANPKYWGGPFGGHGAPAVKTVEFPTLSSNTSALAALDTGQVDWAGNFIADPKQAFAGKPLTFWSPPLNTNSLEPNLHEWPTNQLAVRQAISLAINRKAIASQGESGTEPIATNSSGLTLPVFNQFLAPSVKGAAYHISPKANARAAEKVLEKAGYKKVGKWFALHGKIVKLSVTDPTAYSDYAHDDQIVAADLRAAGIDATAVGLAVNTWNSDMATGNFQLTMHWSNTSVAPYQLYDGWLNSTLATKSNRAGNYEGLHNAAIDRDLKKLASAGTITAQRNALAPIEQFVAKNLPVIPTVYGVSWGEYNTSAFTGWPTPSNEYESAQPATPTNEVVVLHLRPKS